MAIIARGHTPCALCGDVLADEVIVATTHFATSVFDMFAHLSDIGMHQRCFAEWPLRSTFIDYYNGRAVGFARNGLALHMDPDGSQHWQPWSPETSPTSVIAPRHMALRMGCQERRPGVFVIIATIAGLKRSQMRVLCAIEMPEHMTAEGRAALFEKARVSRLEHFRTMMTTGQHGLETELRSHAPADFANTPDAPGEGAAYLEILGADLSGGTHALYLPDLPGSAVVTCWILSG